MILEARRGNRYGCSWQRRNVPFSDARMQTLSAASASAGSAFRSSPIVSESETSRDPTATTTLTVGVGLRRSACRGRNHITKRVSVLVNLQLSKPLSCDVVCASQAFGKASSQLDLCAPQRWR